MNNYRAELRLSSKQSTARKAGFKRGPFYLLMKHWQLTLMVLPSLCFILLFEYIPLSFLVIAFKDYNIGLGIMESPWVGFKYFEQIFTYPDMLRLLRNTVVISVLVLICGFPAPILLAILLNELRQPLFKRIVQTISYLPHFFPWTIVAGLILFFFSVDGMVNETLGSFGKEPIAFLTDPLHFIQLIVVSGVWKDVGWGTIIYLAAIAGINPTLYEAAIIDGAGRLQRMLNVTLPGMFPAIGITLILAVGGLLSVNFEQIYNLYNPRVYEVADVIDTFVVRAGLLGRQYSLTTAIGFFKGVVALLLVLLSNFLVRRFTGKENSLF